MTDETATKSMSEATQSGGVELYHPDERPDFEYDRDDSCRLLGEEDPEEYYVITTRLWNYDAKWNVTLPTDGLTIDWYGDVFLNPPFSEKGEWLASVFRRLIN